MEGLDALLEALGRLIADRFAQANANQTTDILGGVRQLAGDAVGSLIGGLMEMGVRFVFLVMGFAARLLLAGFGPQIEFLKQLLFGNPPEMTTGLPIVQTTVRFTTLIAAAGLPAAIAWTGIGWQFSWFEGEDKREQGIRLVGGALLIWFLPNLCQLLLDLTNAIGIGIADYGGPGEGVIPGYATITQAVEDGITATMAGFAVPATVVGGPPLGQVLSQRLLDLSHDPTVMAGAAGLVYSLALVVSAGSAFGRLLVIDALYCLAPLAALASMVPIFRGAFAMWRRSFGTVVLVIIPAGLILKFAAGAMVQVAGGGWLWVAIVAVAAVFVYSTLVGGACWGITLSTTRVVTRVATVGMRPL